MRQWIIGKLHICKGDKITNYERIKEMSVEEMAEFLYGHCECCVYRDRENFRHIKSLCDKGVYKWLNSEVEE